MKSLIECRENKFFISLLLFFIPFLPCNAQLSGNHPAEIGAVLDGYSAINKEVERQTESQAVTTAEVGLLAGEYKNMSQWEEKYNNYLKKVEGHASTLKASTTLYADGVKVLLTLDKIRKAVKNNPEGVLATVSMNNLYMETLTEFIGIYRLLKNTVAQGGKNNMLTGSERSKVLWEIESKMYALSKKLNLLYVSLRHYKMVDVWNRYSSGIINRTPGDKARDAIDRWRRHAKEVTE